MTRRSVPVRFGRREFMRYAGMVGVGASGLLAACRQADPDPAPAGNGQSPSVRPSIEEEPGDLRIYEWLGYGDGSYGDDVLWRDYKKAGFPPPKFTKTFEDDAGFTKVAQGERWDVVHPCAYRFEDWVNLQESGSPVMQPWDTSLISTFGDLNPALQEYGNFGGDQYFVVSDWGFAAPMYRSDKIQPEESWSVLFDERYRGRISWWDSLNMFIVAGYLNGVPDPWAMSDEELDAQRDFLISKVPLVRTFWVDDPTPDLVNGDVDVAYAWQNHWWAAVGYGVPADAVPAVYMNPREGRTSWYCGFALFADTENYHHAHEYVSAWTGTRAAEWLINNYAYGHTNTALDLSTVNQDLLEQFSLDDPSVLQEPNSHPERPIERRDVYNELWLEVKAAA